MNRNDVVICKKISMIIIDNITYNMSDIEDKNKTVFYSFIKKNINKITYFKIDNQFEVYCKNTLYHSLCDFAINRFDANYGQYFIDGLFVPKECWETHPQRKRFIREQKLNNILND